MHAVLVSATIEPGHDEEAQAQLESNIVPMVKQSPGAVSGHWMRSDDGQHGSSVVLFESEQTARAAAEMVPNAPRPDFVRIDSVEVRGGSGAVLTQIAPVPSPTTRVRRCGIGGVEPGGRVPGHPAPDFDACSLPL